MPAIAVINAMPTRTPDSTRLNASFTPPCRARNARRPPYAVTIAITTDSTTMAAVMRHREITVQTVHADQMLWRSEPEQHAEDTTLKQQRLAGRDKEQELTERTSAQIQEG